MTIYKIFLLLILSFLFFYSFSFAQSESLSIETYYPAPYGTYSELTTTGNTYLATERDNVGIGTTAPNAKLHVVGDGGTAAVFMSGNVGIGTVNPVYALDVEDTNNAVATAVSIHNAGSQGASVRLEAGAHSWSVRAAGSADGLPGRFVVRDLTNSQNRLVIG